MKTEKRFLLNVGIILIVLININLIFGVNEGINLQTTISEVTDIPTNSLVVNPEIVQNNNFKSQVLDSGRNLCEFMNGCYVKDKCYYLGYRKEGIYCAESGMVSKNGLQPRKEYFIFVEQLESNSKCENHFECKSNFCFNKKCVSEVKSLILGLFLRVDNLEDKILKDDEKIEIETKMESLEESNIEEKIGFFGRIKNIFNKD